MTPNLNSSPWWRRLNGYTRTTLKRYPLACLWLGLTFVLATLAMGMLVQRLQAGAAAPSRLETALTLYQLGEARQAQLLFAAVAPSDRAYGLAQAYDALCRYALCRAEGANDYQWFFAALESPAVQQAVLPVELREDLAFKEIDALYQSEQFHTHKTLATTKIAAFRQEYPASARMEALGEYELAAWFERGMKVIYKASFSENCGFYEQWTNGLAPLQQFLTGVEGLPGNDYVVLRDRSLVEDVQLALAVLGGESAAPKGIRLRSAEAQARYGLVRVGLHQKLHPEAWEQNLQMLAAFQKELLRLPASGVQARVKRDLAHFGFRAGAQLCEEAGSVPPDKELEAQAKFAAASRYFESARALQREVVVNLPARITPVGVAALRLDYFNSYFMGRDYAGLSAVTAAQLAKSLPGSLDWGVAKVFNGIALSCQSPEQPGPAVAVFEEVMASGFDGAKKDPLHDAALLLAARWRMHLARITGDRTRALELMQWVEQGKCKAGLKEKFLQDHAWVTAWLEPGKGKAKLKENSLKAPARGARGAGLK